MKENLIRSYLTGITNKEHGETYGRIMRYFLPEFVTSLLLYSMPIILDAYFISNLKSTVVYSTLGATNNLIHFIIKVAEALSIGTVVLAGYYNSKDDFKGVGKVLRDSFWTTLIIGFCVSSFLYIGAYQIYTWYVPAELVSIGVPFLRLRAIGIFCMFLFMACVGFLRGIKNARAPMKIFIAGALVFLFFDYAFIFGKFGMPAMGLQGSALASVAQYVFMLLVIVGYILWNKKNRKYSCELFSIFNDKNEIKRLLSMSWPVVLDKATMSLAYIWLLRMMKPMGTNVVATFSVVKDMERFAFLPAIASAQVITFLVSNDLGLSNWVSIKTNIKKVIFVSSGLVFSFLLVMSLWPKFFIQLFDKKGDFIDLAATVFPILSLLVLFDLLQLILSGALRGSKNVKTVMWIRLFVCFGYFIPVSYVISQWLPIDNTALKFVLIYGAFYIGNGIMSVAYIKRFRSDKWIPQTTQG